MNGQVGGPIARLYRLPDQRNRTGCIAVANAFFDASGLRLREYPMTPQRVLAALGART
jgi:hypothetical protein